MGAHASHSIRAASAVVTLAALMLMVGPVVRAQDSDYCDALTVDEIAEAVPGTYGAPGAFAGTCQWQGTTTQGALVDVILYAIPGSATDLGVAGGSETSVAGHQAFSLTDTTTDPPTGMVAVDLGGNFVLLTLSTSDAAVDVSAAASQLAETAIGRIAAESQVQIGSDDDTNAGISAEASTHGDPCSLFSPDELGALMGAALSAFAGGASCQWQSADGMQAVSVAFDEAGLDTMETIFPGGEHTTLAGQPAYEVDQSFPGFGIYQIFIDLGPETFTLLTNSIDPDVDVAAVARQLTETALGRGLRVLPEPEPAGGMAGGLCQLASPAEIAAAVGLDVTLELQDYQVACTYEGGLADAHILIYVATQDASSFEDMIAAIGASQVDGPGESSWWWQDYMSLFTRDGDTVLQVAVTPDTETPMAELQRLAIAVMEALLAT